VLSTRTSFPALGLWLGLWLGLGLVTVAALTLASGQASAAGLFFSERGVRPLARGGAYIAGADDASSITYNPAGLAFAGREFMVDASIVSYSGSYQRRALAQQTDPNTGEKTGAAWEQQFDTVEAQSPVVPIPTVVYVDSLGVKDANFALGVWAPYAAITSYPETLDDGSSAPQRYSLLSLEGSVLAVVGAYGAYKPSEQVAFGGGIEVLAGSFVTGIAFSTCVPDRFLCAPQQPSYDAISQLNVGPIVAPSATFGVTVVPDDDFRLGLAYHAPFYVSANAEVDLRMPSAAVFDGATQSGNTGRVDFALPHTIRMGVEYRGVPNTRIEVAGVIETWSIHDTIHFQPDNIALENVNAFPQRYEVSGISIARGFQNSYSARFGGEHTARIGDDELTLRGGAMYETSAVPPSMLSVTTVDLDKMTLALGAGYAFGQWRVDAVFARVMGFSQNVGVHEAAIGAVNPIQANQGEDLNAVNAGSYEASGNVFGLGLLYQFGAADEKLHSAQAD
jgi:long-chain fatty acid transport protein